jgi:hypothetical protein
MATNNPIDSLDPIQVALGGTGNSSLSSKGILYGNGTGNVGVTSAGNSGQVLVSNGAGNPPTFQSIVGNLTLISSGSVVNGASSFTITSGITNAYNTYLLLCTGLECTATSDQLALQVSTNGGSSYLTSGYTSGTTGGDIANNFANNTSTSEFFISFTTMSSFFSTIWLYGMSSGSNMMISGESVGQNQAAGAGGIARAYHHGTVNTSSINALKIFFAGGSTFLQSGSGVITLFGLSE